MTPLLDVAGVSAAYGESPVLHDVSLQVAPGETVCLLGANGAGKTTALKAITGLLTPTAGQIRLDGEDLAAVPAHRRVGRGIAMVPEARQLFPRLSVEENLRIGAYSRHARAASAAAFEQVYALFPRLRERRRQIAGLMSGGEQQMVAIGRALMARPRLILLDEPSLGLAPLVILSVYAAIAEIARDGIAILLVEQNTEAAFRVAKRGYVLSHGRIAAALEGARLRDTTLLREIMLGHTAC